MDILISAHNPMTGPRHLGHHVSTMREWPQLQKKYECFFVIDDLIAVLMYPRERKEIFERSLFVAREFMACGIDLKRCHIFLTSMVPESLELMTYLSNYIDHGFCDDLFKRSFLGLISPQDREEIGLPLVPSIAELTYPQLALPALTLGLGAKAFQGGEEISGYLMIMRQLVRQFNAANKLQLVAPIWEQPETSFLHGTDGNHMMSENAIYVSDTGSSRHDRYADAHPETMRHMAAALAPAKAAAGAEHKHLQTLLDRETECYRTTSASSDQVMDCVADGAARAKFLVRGTLERVRQSLSIPHIIEY